MITRSRISECFTSLVGWRESAKAGSCFDSLTPELKVSNSGLYFNDLPLISLEVINDALGEDYADVNDYLEKLYDSTVLELMNRFIINQKDKLYTKALLSNYDMGVQFAQAARNYGITNNRFVGYEIRPHSSNSIKAEVIQLGGAFKQTQNNLPIYFYHENQIEPLAIFYVDIDKTNSVVWFELRQQSSQSASTPLTNPYEIIASYINRDYGHGARYYLGYYESDLEPGNAPVYTQWPGFGCGVCNGGKYTKHKEYVSIAPCEVQSGFTYLSRELFETNQVGYSQDTYGLFMKLNVSCDISEVLCDNTLMFANALQKAVGIKVLYDLHHSNSQNSTVVNKKGEALFQARRLEFQLYGGTDEEGRRHKGEIDTLSVDFSNIDTQCLGARKGAMGLMNL